MLRYRQPASIGKQSLPWAPEGAETGNLPGKASRDAWESQTLPVGNGRIGGTVYGGDRLECVVLNEVSLWSGGPNTGNNGAGYVYGPLAGSDTFGNYQPFGNLFIRFDGIGQTQQYERRLDLLNALAETEFNDNGVRHRRECFVSRPDNVLVYTAEADKPGSVSAEIALLPYHNVQYSVSGNTIIMSGTLANGEKFEGRVQLRISGGKAKVSGKGKQQKNVEYQRTVPNNADTLVPVYSAEGIPYFEVKGADSVTVLVALATDYRQSCKDNWKGKAPGKKNAAVMAALNGKDAAAIRSTHIRDHQALFNRLSINLGRSNTETASLPTDERIVRYRNGGQDPELEALIYQYGRYMLIAGSRPGNLPANLQGIWNNKVHPAWACDYHNNINLQMCYWGAEVGNLPECHLPLIRFIETMQAPLHEMTCRQFGNDTPGWTTRISQNPWGGGGWTKWNPPVNAWYALHVWEHYLFNRDTAYLRKTAYPIMKEVCRFWEKKLKKLGAGGKGLISDGKPLSSTEHPELAEIREGALVAPDGWSHEWGPIEDGCAHDQQLIRELFDNTVQAARILRTDADWARGLEEKKKRLVTDRIAAGGYLQEWIVDRPDKVSGHRHTSHLFGVFPGASISPAETPEIAAAAMKSLELRGMSGDNRRSWTWPWRTALWARFGRADKAYEMVRGYICHNVLDNLFGNHPPMQMDGTFGMTGAMSEMLLQSHAGQIELLPALPDAWADGSVRGIRARGNITVDIEWKNRCVTDYSLTTTSPNPVPVKLIVNGKAEQVTPTVVPVTK